MASYLVLTPPGGPDKSRFSTRFIRDGFSILAFAFPALWLAFNRLWLPAILAFLLQLASGQLIQTPGFLLAGLAIGLALNLLTALEGRNLVATMLQMKGWTLQGVINADSLDSAEEIYAAAYAPVKTADDTSPAIERVRPATPVQGTGRSASAAGLLLSDGGRR